MERQNILINVSKPLQCSCFRTSIWDETLYKVESCRGRIGRDVTKPSFAGLVTNCLSTCTECQKLREDIDEFRRHHRCR